MISRLLFGFLLGAALLVLTAPDAEAQLSIGSPMPAADRALPNASGSAASLSSLAGDRATVVIFWSNQCKWTKGYAGRVRTLISEFGGQGVNFVLVNSNSAGDFPQESLEASRSAGFSIPYLKDEGAQVASAFGAKRTPHVFVFNGEGRLAYTGTIDDSAGDPGAVEKPYLNSALRALVNGNAPTTKTTNSWGCTLRN